MTVLIMVVACLGAALVGRSLIPWMFGSAFAPSFSILLYMLPGVLLISAVTVLSQYLVASGFPIALVIVWIGGFGAGLLAGIPLTRSYGAVGAAAAQSIATAAVCIGAIWLTARRIRGLRPMATSV
jgi:O-antigen/teichoic acid export membrane protein